MLRPTVAAGFFAPPWNESASLAEATVKERVSKIERGGLHLPEMERRYAWRPTRVRGLLDSLYCGCPSGAILIWESDERVPKQALAMGQQANPYAKTPSQSIPELIAANDPQPFESQCIPTDSALLMPDRYHDFLSEQCRCIASRLNTYLGFASSSA
jgi:hypothetical protein